MGTTPSKNVKETGADPGDILIGLVSNTTPDFYYRYSTDKSLGKEDESQDRIKFFTQAKVFMLMPLRKYYGTDLSSKQLPN